MADVPVQTVSQVTRQIKDLVEANFPYVCVLGEISNITRAGSGHVYLTLKDESAQLRAVIWRRAASQIRFDLHDGLEVVAAGPIELYEARGGYQLIIEQLVPQGVGALELAFRQLQAKLAAEGLFDPSRKRPLPRFPRRIALVTSPTGAAVRDMLQVITRRWRAADIVILPVSVQGERAAPEIAAAFDLIRRFPNFDVVITGRGGGSLEDLWPFNTELVARAIAACPIPVVSAVGHEIDVSIADLVADRRALTPSEAGEIVVPDRAAVVGALAAMRDQLRSALRERAARARLRIESIANRRVFSHPLERVHDLSSRLDDLTARMSRAVCGRVAGDRRRIETLAASLDALSPLAVLKRGYSLTEHADSREIVRDAASLNPGDRIRTWLATGMLHSVVESADPAAKLGSRAESPDPPADSQ